MIKIKYRNGFKKDMKLAKKRGKNLNKLQEIILQLAETGKVNFKFRDHALVGNYHGRCECHIDPEQVGGRPAAHGLIAGQLLTMAGDGVIRHLSRQKRQRRFQHGDVDHLPLAGVGRRVQPIAATHSANFSAGV